MTPRLPTCDECSNNAIVFENEFSVGYAIWYPQMGGYIARAIAVVSKEWEEYESGSRSGGCVDMFIWHDGEFPFTEGNPRELHHCDPQQFTDFGNTLCMLNYQHLKVNQPSPSS